MTERPTMRARALAQEHVGGLVGLFDDMVGADPEHAQPQLVGESRQVLDSRIHASRIGGRTAVRASRARDRPAAPFTVR